MFRLCDLATAFMCVVALAAVLLLATGGIA